MTLRVWQFAVLAFMILIFPGVVSGSISIGDGTTSSISGSCELQGSFVASNNGATFAASSTGVVDNFRRDQQLEFDGKGTIHSSASINGGSIGTYSEITTPTEHDTETYVNFIAKGTSVDVALSGVKGFNTANQEANAGNGILATSLSLATGDDLYVTQQTHMNAETGGLFSSALGAGNYMEATGEGYINGAVNADLKASASERASVSGSISDKYNELLSDKYLQEVASNENIGVSTSTLYVGLNSFDTNAINQGLSSAVTASTASPTIPSDNNGYFTAYTNNAYKFLGWKWQNLGIPLLVDSSDEGNGISGTQFAGVIANAVSTWNSGSGKTLFGSPSTQSSGVSTFTRDDINEIGWKKFGNSNTLGQTTAWNAATNIANMLPSNGNRLSPTRWVTESDIVFNSDTGVKWSAAKQPSSSITTIDAQAVAVHEMGHLLGLAHVTYDKKEIMYPYYSNSYPNVGRSLGKGDIAGIKKLYP